MRIIVEILELDQGSSEYRRRCLVSVDDQGTIATDTGEPTGLEDVRPFDPVSGEFVSIEQDPRAWALNLPTALRTPYLVARSTELED